MKNRKLKNLRQASGCIPYPCRRIELYKNDSLLTEIRKEESRDIRLITYINPPIETAKGYKGNLVIEGGKNTTIVQISLQDNNKQRATDFINYLVACYNQDILDEKVKSY